MGRTGIQYEWNILIEVNPTQVRKLLGHPVLHVHLLGCVNLHPQAGVAGMGNHATYDGYDKDSFNEHVHPSDSDDSHCGEFASAEQSFSSAISEAATEADDLVTASTSLENVEVSQCAGSPNLISKIRKCVQFVY